VLVSGTSANAFREVIGIEEFASLWIASCDPSMSREQRPGRLRDTAAQCSAHELKCRWRMQLD
jgi:hypothetical protein